MYEKNRASILFLEQFFCGRFRCLRVFSCETFSPLYFPLRISNSQSSSEKVCPRDGGWGQGHVCCDRDTVSDRAYVPVVDNVDCSVQIILEQVECLESIKFILTWKYARITSGLKKGWLVVEGFDQYMLFMYG